MTLLELLPLVAIAAVFWFLIIRPSLVRRREQAAVLSSLAPGQQVMTTAGVFGTIVAIEGDRVSLQVAPGVVIELLALAVAKVVPADTETSDPMEAARAADAHSDDATPESDRG